MRGTGLATRSASDLNVGTLGGFRASVKTPPVLSLLLLAALAGCGPAPFQVSSDASGSISVAGRPGSSPFIAFLDLSGPTIGDVTSVTYSVQPRAGSVSKPVQATFSISALQTRGYVAETGKLTVPVFGLYPGAQNQATVGLQFSDASSQLVHVQITTETYEDPHAVYDHATILQPRAPGSTLGFDFFAMKSTLDSVVVVDTDGMVRWVGNGTPSQAVIFDNGGFIVGSQSSAQFQRLELDGTSTGGQVGDPAVLDFTHNIDPGKSGFLAEFDITGDADATVEEITRDGAVLASWKMGDVLSAYMSAHGDDPTTFVRPGVDWFHVNAATYDPSDDSMIVSSRENFVIKLDYTSGEPIWILGDPTKYWYTFPSLRAKALTLAEGGFYPIGQHATSITADGRLMLFNDGAASLNQPDGAPPGDSRNFSVVSAYAIDPVAMTAQEVWRFEHQPDLQSSFCSSSYEVGQTYLVNYAMATGGTTTRLLGLDSNRQVVFDFSYPNPGGCQTSWNAVPVPFDDLQFQ